eukprot:1299544-Prymnesium_polylepis.1
MPTSTGRLGSAMSCHTSSPLEGRRCGARRWKLEMPSSPVTFFLFSSASSTWPADSPASAVPANNAPRRAACEKRVIMYAAVAEGRRRRLGGADWSTQSRRRCEYISVKRIIPWPRDGRWPMLSPKA